MVIAILLTVSLSYVMNRPPAVVPAQAPEEVFSAQRAAWHLEQIANERNPIGSPANERVRRYIFEQLELLGAAPQLQIQEVFDPVGQRAATLGNVLARIPGTGGGQAILIMGHYDTVADAYGASDNGSAVVTMLELIRMLGHHPPLSNDLVFFFPDGEEVGLLGARAFLADHPWATDVDLVINLEARGTKGQSILFETGSGNLETIRAYSRAVPFPTGNSLAVEVYNRMPTSTDFTVFRAAGYQGLNFAYIDNGFDYHTGGDNIENTDLRSIQHHGEHAAALILSLGNDGADRVSEQDAVYFNTLGYGFVYYPYGRVAATSLLVALLTLALTGLGIFRKKIDPLKLLCALASFGILLLLLYAGSGATGRILQNNFPGGDFRLLEYNHRGILLGLVLLSWGFSTIYFRLLTRGIRAREAFALPAAVLALLVWSGQFHWLMVMAGLGVWAWLWLAHRKPSATWELTSGAIMAWVGLMIFSSFSVKGASFLFTWPLLFSLLPMGVAMLARGKMEDGLPMGILLLVSAIPLLSWFAILLYLFHVAMGLQAMAITITAAGLATGLLIPHSGIMTRQRPWLIPGLLMGGGLVFFLTATLVTGYDQRHRKENNIMYVSSDITGETYWISLDSEVDEWTEQFLGTEPDTIDLGAFFPLSTRKVLARQTSTPAIPPPSVRVLSDRVEQGRRELSLEVVPRKEASRLVFYFDSGEGQTGLQIGDLKRHVLRPRPGSGRAVLTYFAPPEAGITLNISTGEGQPVGFWYTVHDDTGVPAFAGHKERPPHMMRKGDQSVISGYVLFEQSPTPNVPPR